jgi:hypothetical protein
MCYREVMKQRDRLNLPVLVDCMPNEQPPPTGQMTWGHPSANGLPVRIFMRSDLSNHVSQLSPGQREHFLSLMKLMSAIGNRDWTAIRHARNLFDTAVTTILTENRELATKVRAWAQTEDLRLPVQGSRSGSLVLEFEPDALYQLAKDLEKPEMPPIPEDANPELLMSALVSHVTRRTKFVLWSHNGQLIPALYCASDFFLAAVTFTLMGEWLGWEMCRNCGKFFRQGRRDQKWCSDACGNAHRVKKSQAKTRAAKPSR